MGTDSLALRSLRFFLIMQKKDEIFRNLHQPCKRQGPRYSIMIISIYKKETFKQESPNSSTAETPSPRRKGCSFRDKTKVCQKFASLSLNGSTPSIIITKSSPDLTLGHNRHSSFDQTVCRHLATVSNDIKIRVAKSARCY
jgi:hypothetical protein